MQPQTDPAQPVQYVVIPPQAQPAAPPPAPAPPTQPAPTTPVDPDEPKVPGELIIYSHSSLFYWWPVWVLGYILTAITYFQGHAYEADGGTFWVHPKGSLGVVFLVVMFLVILITNISLRGLASALVIMGAVLLTVLFALFNVWDEILGWLGNLRIYLNVGAYFWFSTLIFTAWALAVFVFDRMSYWRVQPGQVTREFVVGAATETYDTKNLVLQKYRDDLFRHWILGLGSGDLHMKPFGARSEDIEIPNVLFIGSKIEKFQQLINTEPARITGPAVG